MAPDSRRKFIEQLPASEMVYPDSLVHRMKYYFWYYYTPYHPYVRDSALALSLVKVEGRQPYLLGKVAPHLSIEEFVAVLVKNGFAYHRVAWEDEGEMVSLRYVENFVYQYHVRVFSDGEVRAHYEYTPECYPMLHLFEVGHEARKEEFMRMFGEHLTPHTSDDREGFRWGFLPLKKYLWE